VIDAALAVAAAGLSLAAAVDRGYVATRFQSLFQLGIRGAVRLFLRPSGYYRTNKPLGNGFCPRLGRNGASARLASSSRRLEGL